ncbi:MAG TPA: PilZ domain-containing protein [Myxococcota bacterium]|nr:PilZ domain-containing protein [Myxococcota bacterium]
MPPLPLPEPRVAAQLPVVYAVGTSDFAGTVVNISRTGVLVRVDHRVPDLGARIRLFISNAREQQIEVYARVVREIPRGFAAQFLAVPIELLELLADLGG